MFGFSSKPTPAKFAQLITKALAKAGVQGPFEYRQEDFSLRGTKQVFYMKNMFDAYCEANGPQRAVILANIVSIFQTQKAEVDREEALSTAVAVVRERALFAFTSLLWQVDDFEDEGKTVAQEPISAWYTRTLVLDAPGSMRFVNEEDLTKWEISFDELFAVGLEMLRNSTPIQMQEEGGYFVGLWKDDYDSSRILLPDLFEKLGLDGDPVFVLPNRLTLMVAGSNDEAGIVAMLQKGEGILQTQHRPQNLSPLTYRGGELIDFTPHPSSKLFPLVQRAQKMSAHGYYEEQKARLEELHKKTGKDYFIATYTVAQNETGEFVSCAVWPKDVATLLPRTDMILLRDTTPDRTFSVKFENALRLVDDLMLDTGMFPARFYVCKLPTDEQLTAMGAETM